jgi:tRNA nucleotidyltransferase (CCA-adding enzyme)
MQAVAAAHDLRLPCYLVGGPVRDLLLGRMVDDIDLVFEGDAIAVAERFAARMGGQITRHTAFGTASVTVEVADRRLDVDFVTARTESYPEPAALPIVAPATIAADLRRRDFTINTLALELSGMDAFTLLDLCGGVPDLRSGIIRVLHDRSFVDDPTRIVRAARFAARLGFAVEPHTEALAIDAASEGMIERTSPARILHELWLTFREPAPQAVFDILAHQRALDHIVPMISWTPELAQMMAAIRALDVPPEEQRLLLLGMLAWALSPAGREAFVRRYGFSTAERRVIAESDALPALIATIEEQDLRPSELDRMLHGLGDTALLLGEIVAPHRTGHTLAHYRQKLRPMRTLLNGDDLAALGIPRGPRYRALLSSLRAAQLDGHVGTRAEAERWVLDHLHQAES